MKDEVQKKRSTNESLIFVIMIFVTVITILLLIYWS